MNLDYLRDENIFLLNFHYFVVFGLPFVFPFPNRLSLFFTYKNSLFAFLILAFIAIEKIGL
ncbi:hypothetical protein BSM4216_1331 [Bacillus smithii]|nr:hypothetical protein BSM4216_1331 [Bacillus smithii]